MLEAIGVFVRNVYESYDFSISVEQTNKHKCALMFDMHAYEQRAKTYVCMQVPMWALVLVTPVHHKFGRTHID